MTRYGVLSAAAGALSVGDTDRRHIRLTLPGMEVRRGEERVDLMPWRDVSRVALDVPMTSSRIRAVMPIFGYSVLALLTFEVLEVTVPDARMIVTTGEEDVILPLSRPLPSPYQRRAVEAAERLFAALIADPAVREELRHPQRLLNRVRRG